MTNFFAIAHLIANAQNLLTGILEGFEMNFHEIKMEKHSFILKYNLDLLKSSLFIPMQ